MLGQIGNVDGVVVDENGGERSALDLDEVLFGDAIDDRFVRQTGDTFSSVRMRGGEQRG